ncbi:hypothetical protein CMK22_11630 [Candidatus Poribacteria bacterium]|nr:hypothetical protein [Candidatus Poribacteria bacterium]
MDIEKTGKSQTNQASNAFKSIDIETEVNQAIVYHRSGKLQQAEQICQQILDIDPQNAEVLNLFGLIACQAGKYEIAVDLINHALDISSNQPLFLNNLGFVLKEQGKISEAIAAYSQALDMTPESFEIYNNLGVALYKQRKYDKAIEAYQKAIQIQPDFIEAYNNLGVAFKKKGELNSATQVYYQALRIQPDFAEAHRNLGDILQKQGEYDKAIEAYQKAIQIQPDYAAAYNNLGIAWQKQGKLEQAVQIYNKTLVIRPNYPQAYNNLANTLKEQGKLQEAVQVYHKAIEINPSYIDAHKNLGIVLLLQGDFQRGWQEYEWRLKPDDLCSGNRARTRWDGSSLSGKTILLYAEQGFGDTIQFIRYVHLLMEYDTKILVECQPELLQLFGNIGAIQKTIAVGQSLPKFDVNASLLSLPSILGTDLSSIPAKIPYLYVKSQSNTDLEMPSEYKVGVVWAGNLKHPDDNNRSVGLQQFSVLFDVVNCQFFSLQVGNRRDDIIRYSYSDEITDLGVNFSDFFDTAVAISELDLVISVDTAVAHLAGALGKPVWVLLPFVPDWRWLLEREDTPWYPTMRLFRQTNTRDWAEVLKKVRLALEKTSIGSKKAYNN